MQGCSEQDLDLPKSIAALGTAHFEEVLEEELQSISTELPLERMSTGGGWPDDDTLDTQVSSVKVFELNRPGFRGGCLV